MRFLSILAADLRFALRMMRQNPTFSSIAIVCLALGIGATSAMSSLIYALWVDPYPYRDSNRLLNLSFVNQEGRTGTMWYSLADYLELQRSTTTLEEIAARDGMTAVVTSGLPESIHVVLFTPNAFDHFGVPAMIGRTWNAQRHSSARRPAASCRTQLSVLDTTLQCRSRDHWPDNRAESPLVHYPWSRATPLYLERRGHLSSDVRHAGPETLRCVDDSREKGH